MTERSEIAFDLDHVLEILRSGVRRADVLMGVGTNASLHDPAISHILAPEGMHHIQLVKGELTDEEKVHVAGEFGKWVRTNGLRDLIETFSIFLDRLYEPLFVLNKGFDGNGKRLSPPKVYERRGITDKLDTLSRILEINETERKVLASLNQARNCFAHRRGVVGEPDVDPKVGHMTLVWTAFQFEIEEPDGNVVVENDVVGRVFEQGGMARIRVVERARSFAPATELELEKQDLKEICFATLTIGQRLLHATVETARKAGVLKEKVDESLIDPKPV